MVEQYGAVRERIRVVPNGVQVTEFFPPQIRAARHLRHALGIEDDEYLILHAGRVDERKGQRELIDAAPRMFELARNNRKRLRLVFLGWTRNFWAQSLEKRIKHSGLEREVLLLPPVPHRDIAQYYWASNVVTIAGPYDVMPLAMLEAMAAGRPVVATSNGGPVEIIDSNIDGLLVDTTNIEQLSGAVMRVCCDASFAKQIGAAAHKKITLQFSWEAATERLYDIYMELCGGNTGLDKIRVKSTYSCG